MSEPVKRSRSDEPASIVESGAKRVKSEEMLLENQREAQLHIVHGSQPR